MLLEQSAGTKDLLWSIILSALRNVDRRPEAKDSIDSMKGRARLCEPRATTSSVAAALTLVRGGFIFVSTAFRTEEKAGVSSFLFPIDGPTVTVVHYRSRVTLGWFEVKPKLCQCRERCNKTEYNDHKHGSDLCWYDC